MQVTVFQKQLFSRFNGTEGNSSFLLALKETVLVSKKTASKKTSEGTFDMTTSS